MLNFGVSSYSPVLEYILLKKEVLSYKPDLLILALDPCDIQDDYFYEQHLLRDGKGEIVACDPFRKNGHPDWWALLKEKSVFFAIIDEKGLQSLRKMRILGLGKYWEHKRNKKRIKTAILEDPLLDNIEFDRFIFVREQKSPPIVMKHWDRTAKYLRDIKRICDENGIQLLLVSYPYGHQVGTNQWTKGREYWAFDPSRTYVPGPGFGMIRRFALENQIKHVDLWDSLRQHADELLYFNNDGHWTARGHEVVAETLAKSIS